MSADDPSPLALKLAQRITEQGPIGIADYMAAALTDPEHGYYMGRDPLGAAGDFITAPEVSQMFGELIGLWCAETWARLGAPAPVALVELGPGRGTLMADALRAAHQVPAFADALRVHLVEVSPSLRARQEETLADVKPSWHESLAGVPDLPVLLIANEFFDALPVRQLVKQAGGWGERLVGPDTDREALAFTVSPADPAVESLVPEALRDAPPGSLFEAAPAGQAVAHEIGRRLAAPGRAARSGAALIVDYGHEESALGETLQAVRCHAPHDVLSEPGTADLTCHVDFAALARAAQEAGAAAHGPVDQGTFLERLGIAARAARLMEKATPPQREDIRSARLRLTAPDRMGTLFKVLALTPAGLDPPAGFQ